MIELMGLVETGTRAMIGAVFGPPAESETGYASRLLHLLGPDMLLLTDRGFDTETFLAAVNATEAQFLARIRNNRRLAVLARLDDGSYLAKFGVLTVRIIDADITVTCVDGTTWHDTYRLATTLTDPRRNPATALIAVYHERWEHEITYLALRHTLLGGRVLRSTDPGGVQQEMWALLTLYQTIRIAMVTAVESAPGTDPDRADFTLAQQTATELLINAEGVIAGERIDPIGNIGRAILADLHHPRRPRTSVRKVKSPLSRYNKADPHRPRCSTKITAIHIGITNTNHPRTPRPSNDLTTAPEP